MKAVQGQERKRRECKLEKERRDKFKIRSEDDVRLSEVKVGQVES